MQRHGKIFFIEKNIRGAWVVYGTEGLKQYYNCTRAEAKKKYEEDYNCFINIKDI